MSEPTLNATVVLRRDLNGRLAVVRVSPRDWELPAHEPGQFATLGLPDPDGPGKFLRRVYSIASAPGADHAEFYIQLVKEGPFTTRLWHLHEGDALHLSPKVGGAFTLAGVPEGADVLLLSMAHRPEQLRAIGERLGGPLMYLAGRGGLAGSGLTLEELGRFGYRIVADPSTPLLAAFAAWKKVYAELADGFGARIATRPDWSPVEQEMLGVIGIEALLAVERATVERPR